MSDPLDDPKLTGLKRVFSGHTIRGRANVAKATVAFLFSIFAYFKFIKPKLSESPPK